MRKWYEQRLYQHLDGLCSPGFIKSCEDPAIIMRHSWSPLIYFEKSTRKYKQKLGKTTSKIRPIMYASHQDSAIFAKYAGKLSALLEARYAAEKIGDCVIAYRSLGGANYHFAAEVDLFVRQNVPCCVLCFDFSKFFDTLDHSYLRNRMRDVLNCRELSKDWYAVFKNLTKFHYIKKDDLLSHPKFTAIIHAGFPRQIASIEEIKKAVVRIHKNDDKFGIPQGTPISAVMSNVYMLEFDLIMHKYISSLGGLYRRYSDDIIIVSRIESEKDVKLQVENLAKCIKLSMNEGKTETNFIKAREDIRYQYLGFDFNEDGAIIRGSSVARQGRKLSYALKRTGRVGREAVRNGTASKIYTKRLRFRFVDPQHRNFPNYARRAAKILQSKSLYRQAARLERKADLGIRNL